jgi:LmbE family N-acetylglucosaminyl deacetylase
MIRFLLDQKRLPLKILCLGSHPDDIEIGCGGTLLQLEHWYQQQLIVWWIVFSGTTEREKEAKDSAEAFLTLSQKTTLVIHHFEDSYFPYSGREIKQTIHELSREFDPDVIFTHRSHDAHQDHRLISELTWNAFRDHMIFEYEIPKYDGDLGQPNVFVPLNESICRNKVTHLLTYFGSQRDKRWFNEDTFLSMLRLRGIECNSTSGYAEGFHCRKIVL